MAPVLEIDSEHDGAQVDILDSNQRVCFRADISSLSDGVHTITATVTDSGSLTSGDSITIVVGPIPPGNQPPSVSILNPSNGDTFTSGSRNNFV